MLPQLSDHAKQILHALTERAGDGYTLRARTGIAMDTLQAAVRELTEVGLVRFQGDPYGEQFGKAYFWVPPDLQGKVDYLLGKFSL